MRNWRLAHCEINVDRCVLGCAAPSIQLHDSAQKDDIIMAFLESSVNALIQPAERQSPTAETCLERDALHRLLFRDAKERRPGALRSDIESGSILSFTTRISRRAEVGAACRCSRY